MGQNIVLWQSVVTEQAASGRTRLRENAWVVAGRCGPSHLTVALARQVTLSYSSRLVALAQCGQCACWLHSCDVDRPPCRARVRVCMCVCVYPPSKRETPRAAAAAATGACGMSAASRRAPCSPATTASRCRGAWAGTAVQVNRGLAGLGTPTSHSKGIAEGARLCPPTGPLTPVTLARLTSKPFPAQSAAVVGVENVQF